MFLPYTPNRRDMLLSIAGTGLSLLVPPLGAKAAAKRGVERPRSLLTVWLAGGPSQLETWDPHPGGPNGGPTGAIKTTIPEVAIADLYPEVATQLQHVSVIRSLTSKEGDHQRGSYHVRTGYRPDPSVRHPSVGAVLVHERPPEDLALPPHIALNPGQWSPRGGFLGDKYDAFRVTQLGSALANATPLVSRPRQNRRLDTLAMLEKSFASGRPRIEHRTQHRATTSAALKLMNSEQVKAFEIAEEPTEIRAAYGETTFGKSCLVARRLLETGVRAIEVTLGGFDSHANNFEAHRDRAAILDPALATLIAELVERELYDSTVLLVVGEFGRSPTINVLDGRDHWPNGFSCLLGGAGLHAGRLIGATDPAGLKPPTDPISVPDLTATIFSAVGLDPLSELWAPVGRPLKLSEGNPLAALLE